MTKIQYNSPVQIRYQLLLDDGTEVEDNRDDEPLAFIIGDGTLTDGMDMALLGHQTGDSINVTLTPEQCYGYPDKDNIHAMPVADFPDDMPPEVGQVIAFDGPDDEEIIGTIVEIKNKEVMVDFSHPLAGRNLIFKADIVDVNEAVE